MIQTVLQWLESIGPVGLFIAMFLEGSSLPFPGIAVVLVYGHLLPFSYWGAAWIAAGMSLVYCVASLIPYFIGYKIDHLIQKLPRKGLEKSKNLFVRYGEWSVAVSRPFGLGNYISYIAGITKMGIVRYLTLTFIGIYPWSFFMILLGNYIEGSYQVFQSLLHSYSIYLYIAFVFGIVCILFVIKNKRKTIS